MSNATFLSVIETEGRYYNFNLKDVLSCACYAMMEMEWYDNIQEAKEWLLTSEDAALLAEEFLENYRHDQWSGISHIMLEAVKGQSI